MVLIPKSSCERTGNAYYFLEGGNQDGGEGPMFFKKSNLFGSYCQFKPDAYIILIKKKKKKMKAKNKKAEKANLAK